MENQDPYRGDDIARRQWIEARLAQADQLEEANQRLQEECESLTEDVARLERMARGLAADSDKSLHQIFNEIFNGPKTYACDRDITKGTYTFTEVEFMNAVDGATYCGVPMKELFRRADAIKDLAASKHHNAVIVKSMGDAIEKLKRSNDRLRRAYQPKVAPIVVMVVCTIINLAVLTWGFSG